MSRESIYSIPYSEIPSGSRILIYGAGKLGKNYYQSIKKSNRLKIIAFIDKNACNILTMWSDIPVVEPSNIDKLKFDYILIAIENGDVARTVINYLIECGIGREKIIWGGDINSVSYEAMAEVRKFADRAISAKKRIFIFMLPEHGNTGDYAIGYAEQKFLDKYFDDFDVYGITTTEWIKAKEFFVNLLKDDDIVTINGGGYFGDLRGDDVVYKDIVESFPENIKIFFPNNLTYRVSPVDGSESFFKDIEWVKQQRNLWFFWREKRSYDLFEKYIGNSFLAPDMVFLLKYKRENINVKRNKLLLCLREDCEKIITNCERIEEVLIKNRIEFDKFDINTETYFSQEMGYDLLRYVTNKFQEYECIITDRLHGMILSVISDVPCVAFDNLTGKNSGVYEWIENTGYATMINENQIQDIIDIIRRTCDRKRSVGEYFVNESLFENMSCQIREILTKKA